MLLKDHEQYHKMGPKDVGLKEVTHLQVARTTDHTGEQFAFSIPIYPDDSRDQVRSRINFFLSIMHDRVEDINKAILELNEKQKQAAQLKEMIRRNGQHFINQAKALEKRLKSKRKDSLSREEYEAELAKLREELKAANEPLQKELEALGQEPGQEPEAVPSEGLSVVQGE